MRKRQPLKLDIAILGGGFGGVYCAKILSKALKKRKGLNVGIVSEENYMVFQPMLAEVVGGTLSANHVINPIRKLCRGVYVYKGTVQDIDLDKKNIHIDAGSFSRNVTVEFNYLVLALGAEIDISRVPGMPEHAYLIQNVGDALRLRSTIIGRCEEANFEVDPEIKRRLLTFVFVGGGYSGVETAGQTLDFLRSINKYYKNVDPEDFRVVIVHSRDHVLPTMSPKLGNYALTQLRKAGLEVILKTRVKSITSNKVYLADDSVIESNTVISTVGNSPNRLIRSLCKREDIESKHNWITTNQYLQLPGHSNIWAVGDCASTLHPKDNSPCPPTAQFAIRQGILCGKNILRALDKKPLQPLKFKGFGEIATIRRRKAVAEILGINISGLFAWFLWRTVYLMKLPGIERKLRVVLDWTLDLFYSKDINLLNPEGTKLLSDIHLEKEDPLFNEGDPPFSLYFVKEGRIDMFDGNQLVRSVWPGDFVGERALVKDRPYIYSAVAAEPSKITSLDGNVFRQLIKSSIELKKIFRRSGTRYKTSEEMTKIKSQLKPEVAKKTAAELMQPNLATVKDSLNVAETLEYLNKHRHSSYPVVDDEGKFLGVLNREDVFYFLKSSSITLDTPINTIDYTHLPTVPTTMTADALIEKMLIEGTYKALVVKEEDQLCGIVTLMDIIPLDRDQ